MDSARVRNKASSCVKPSRFWDCLLLVHTLTLLFCLVTRSCPTLKALWIVVPPGFPVHGISQARIVDWVAISFSSGSSHPGIEPRSHALQVDSLLSEPPGKPIVCHSHSQNMVLGPAAAASRNPLEMKLHRHHPRPINSGVGKRTTDI